jgi:N-hydroxyarylamine O-acetyltransferase
MRHVKAYLDWVNYPGTPGVSAGTLFGLHQAHAFTIPFENLDVIHGVPIRLDQERFYDKIVGKNRGGLCYEMNGLFKLVLDSIGFESWFISCQVYFPPAYSLGPALGHVAIITRVGGELYLVDVGFGSGFIQPLKLDFTHLQCQGGTCYRLSSLAGEEILLERSADGQEYHKMYKFSLACRALVDFEQMCRYHQTSPEAPFTRQPLCSRPTPTGRITLTGSALVITAKGEKQEHAIASQAEFKEKLAQYFGITLPAGAQVAE